MTIAPDGLFQYGGVPVPMGNGPSFGKVWFVDGTNGSVGGTGDQVADAISTAQLGLNAQLAETTGLGDIVYVLPGTYTETAVVTSFDKVQLIGVTCGGAGDAVIMQSAAGTALQVGTDGDTAVSMVNSAIRNMTFLGSSGGTRTAPALVIDFIQKSVIADCKFKGVYKGTASAQETVGLQIGSVSDTGAQYHEHCKISRNEFTSNGPRNWEFDTAIQAGAIDSSQHAANGFKSMIIEDNIISAEVYGISLDMGDSSCGGSVIRRNVITSMQGGAGPIFGIQCQYTSVDLLCMIIDNRIVAISDCISNFSQNNTHGNIVCINSAATVGELPAT